MSQYFLKKQLQKSGSNEYKSKYRRSGKEEQEALERIKRMFNIKPLPQAVVERTRAEFNAYKKTQEYKEYTQTIKRKQELSGDFVRYDEPYAFINKGV
jgi:hypothetical protein